MGDVNTPPAGGYQNGGWYWDPSAGAAKQYWNGSFGGGSTINNPNQQGYGQKVDQQWIPNSGNNNGANTTTTNNGPFNLESAYNDAFNTPDIQKATSDLATIDKQIADRQAALDAGLKDVNDNPFYAEGVRTGRAAKVTEQANGDLATLNEQRTQLANTLGSLKQDAMNKVNVENSQNQMTEQNNQNELSKLGSLVSSGAFSNASADEIASYAKAAGLPLDMVQGMISRANSTFATSANGKFNVISALQTVAPQIQSRLNSYGNISPQDWQRALSAWVSAGGQTSDFVSSFGRYADTNRGDFETAYGFKNPKPTTEKSYNPNNNNSSNNQQQNNKPWWDFWDK